MSFNYTNVLRNGLLAGLGTVPEVGSICQFLGSELWPDSGANPLDDLNATIAQLTINIHQDTWITILNTALSKMRAQLELVKNARSTNEKATALKYLYSVTSDNYDIFVRPNNVQKSEDNQPQNTVALLVAYGTIHLGVSCERALHYQDIYGQAPDGDPAADTQAALTEITAKVKADRLRAISWRHGCINVSEKSSTDIGTFKTCYNWTITDAFDPSFNRDPSSEDDDDLNPTSKVRPMVTQYVTDRHFDIQYDVDGYTSNLDNLLDAWRLWKYLDPASPLTTTPGFRYWCNRLGSPGRGRTGAWFSDKAAYQQFGFMTGLRLWWDDGALKGIQAQYGSSSSSSWTSIHGTNQQKGSHDEWWFYPGDDSKTGFTWINIAAGDWVSRFGVNTADRIYNAQTTVGRDDGNITKWVGGSYPLSSSDKRLAYIAGVSDGDVISQLKLVWQVGEQYTTDLPQEWTSDVINDAPW